MRNTIHLAGEFRHIELPIGATAILPGMLVEQAASGAVPHSTAGGYAEKAFAQEDALQGRTKTDPYKTAAQVQTAIGDASAKGDPVSIYVETPGSMTLALLKAGTNYPIGAKLVSAGDGTLRLAAGAEIVLALNLVALDLSGGGAVNTLNEVRVI